MGKRLLFRMLGDLSLCEVDDNPDGAGKSSQHLERVTRTGRHFVHEYARGAACILLKLDTPAGRDADQPNAAGVSPAADEQVPHDQSHQLPLSIEHAHRRVRGRTEDGSNNSMLVGDIKHVDDIENFAFTSDVALEGSQQAPDPIARGLNALARTFEVDFAFAAGELKVLVLRAPVPTDQFPHHVVEGAAQIVDSIAYYDREGAGHGFNEADLNHWLSSASVIFDAESVRLALYEGLELPFKVRDMMLCSLELEAGAFKHGQQT